MLHVDPHQRLTAALVLRHPWIVNGEYLSQNQLSRQDVHLVKVSPNEAALYSCIQKRRVMALEQCGPTCVPQHLFGVALGNI